MLMEREHVAVTSLFEKLHGRKATFRQNKQHPGGPQWVRGNYEVLAYATVATR